MSEKEEYWARGVWEALAVTLAEPLRAAFHAHLEAHGCEKPRGFGYCKEAMELFNLLPDGDTVCLG